MKFNIQHSTFILLFLLLVGCAGSTAVSTPITNTGIPVAEEFAVYYQANGGPRVFGSAITEAFRPEADSPVVQYFQTMRLEFDQQQVTPFPLGEWAFPGIDHVELAAVTGNGRSRTLPGSDYPIQDEFLTFYETHNGEQLFGLPLSPQVDEGGLRVQYFQNARLEWRPELPVAQRVQVSILGQAHFDAEMVFVYRREFARPVSSAGVSNVDLTAAVKYPVLYAGDEQVLYVTAQTADGRSISDIHLIATLTYSDQSIPIDLGVSDESGQVHVVLDLSSIPAGEDVQIRLAASRSDGQVVGSKTLGFRTWW
ncbi:MAG: hypothetical protein H6662_16705 [Ardenticatenaceae bacterium]|nr:hypothetical protein [Anaerolineales bacterium]MCB8923230.1 hypothetical protein [Ardenticatenaceae bacterium]MCB9004825.1 hypothetical protein [Ardenticatenaceae bacterium]